MFIWFLFLFSSLFVIISFGVCKYFPILKINNAVIVGQTAPKFR